MVSLTTTEIVLGLLVLLFAAALLGLLINSRRSAKLQSRFGPEYSQALHDTGDRHKAEAVLRKREKRVATFKIHPLPPVKREEFINGWRNVQSRFVDDPSAAIGEADKLLRDVMHVSGYPVSNFEQRAADLSVDHGSVVENYRAGHDIALRHEQDGASTEELRQAMIHYRALFDDLVNEPDTSPVPDMRKEKNRG